MTRSSPSSHTSLRADAVAPSIAAEDDNPAPTGTSEAIAMSTPVRLAASRPDAANSAHATPSGYVDHSGTSSRPSGKSASSWSSATSTGTGSNVETTRMRPSSRRPSCTCVRCSIANGSTKPSL
ncbi:hypothetical protein QE377_001033 [Microbacterium sp. SORGH_AS 862]|nr:hypothetical protein [Microbacterium sp. SORGH_AS_0862]